MGTGLQEGERYPAAGFGEQALACAGHDRVHEQPELVEQVLGEQEPDQGAAGSDGDIRAGLLLSSVRAAVMSLLITVVGPQSGSFRVAEMTTLGVAVIIPACGGAAGPVNTLRNSS